MDRDSGQVQSVLRACDILRAFRHESETLLLSDVMARTGLPKTTTFRLLQTLTKGGLIEQIGRGVYRSQCHPVVSRPIRMGFASQTDSEFAREVTESLQRVAARERIHLITVNNRYSAREALRNADLLIRERVDLVLEFQTYERVAPIISSKFLEAHIPVIAIEIPHPGAIFFGRITTRPESLRDERLANGPKYTGREKPSRFCSLSCQSQDLCQRFGSQV